MTVFVVTCSSSMFEDNKTVVGVFASQERADAAINKVKVKHPDWFRLHNYDVKEMKVM